MNFESRFYHRQAEVLGQETQKSVRSLKVFIRGLPLAGLEVAKNLAMMGVEQLALFDNTIVSEIDAQNSIYYDRNSIWKDSRAKACLKKIKELTINTEIFASQIDDPQWISRHFDVAVLVDCWDYAYAIALNRKMHSFGKGFIMVGNLSLYGLIFVDFGQSHYLIDGDGQRPQKRYIKKLTNQRQGYLEISEDEEGIKVGSQIYIYNVKGMDEINGKRCKVIRQDYGQRNRCMHIDIDTTSFGLYRSGGIAIPYEKKQKTMTFSLLQQNFLQQLLLLDVQREDNYLIEPKKQLNITQYLLLKSLFTFYAKKGKLPTLFNRQQANELIQTVKSHILFDSLIQNKKKNLLGQLQHISLYGAISNSIFSTIWGGIGAQEVIKFTRKYTPIYQWLHYDQMKLVLDPKDNISCSKYDKNQIIFGKQITQKLQNLNIMMVGAGALGSQFLKIFCELNLGIDKGGITIVDDDLLSDYNLNRMCLVSKQDIGRSKVQILCQKSRKINQKINIVTIQDRIKSPNSKIESKISQKIWKKQDIIISAVDSFDSRLNLDQMCIKHKKILLNCGTQDLKLSTEVIIPHRTMCYIDLKDGKVQYRNFGKRNFPYKIETIVERTVEHLQQILQVSSFLNELSKDKAAFINQYQKQQMRKYGNQAQVYSKLQNIVRLTRIHKSGLYQKCVEEALLTFYQKMTSYPKKLLQNWPQNSRIQQTQDYFWSGLKNVPQIIGFNINDLFHCEYVHSLSKIFAEMLGITPLKEEDTITLAKKIFQGQFFNKICKQRQQIITLNNIQTLQKNEQLVKQIQRSEFNFNFLHKFVPSNPLPSHISFVYSCSILQAKVPQIQEVSRSQIQRVACRSVPTLITGISISAGMLVLQLIKVLKNNYNSCKNTYANFALPLMVQSQLSHPQMVIDLQYDPMLLSASKVIPECQDSWDVMTIVGPLTVSQMKLHLENRFKIVIESIMTIKDSIFIHGFHRITNATIRNMEISAAVKHLLKNRNSTIQFPIQLFIGSTCQNQQSQVLLPPIHYYLQK